MSALESHYRRLMRAYPPAYRQAHGEEIIGTLLQASADRRLPSPREAAGLIGGGVTARMRAATEHPVAWWADGLHLGILLIALTNLALNLAYVSAPSIASAPWEIGYVVLSVALVRGWLWVALPIAVVVAIPAVDFVFSARVPGVFAGLAVQYLAVAAGSVVLALRRSRGLRRRSYVWLAVPVIAWAAAHVHTPMTWTVQPIIALFLLSAGIWATAAARDLRWLLAAAIFVPATIGPDAVITQVYPTSTTAATIVFWGVEVALVLVIGLTAQRTRRSRT
ncbi:hypothetical protein [Actinoallomurus iriomotensis]|uniref:Uncharacterized protein n=1 Tax=Actinoallomurus iriomotensis TaxID=478107 RepID=A0A9W6RL71_9ACTN|nr:hypothetical protein [Actinoallomurus iriomotensis]GLY76062.1 hypothetical protein Airi01_043290 [Actinoallomurus iriomotensis]